MFNLNCNSQNKLIEYMMNLASGKEACGQIKFMNRKHQALATLFESVVKNDKEVLEAVESLLYQSSQLCNFDVEMNHIAKNMFDFSEELATTGESNMSIVEEVSASMSQVNDAVVEHTKTMSSLVEESETLQAINQGSINFLDDIQGLKEQMNDHALFVEKHMKDIDEATFRIQQLLSKFDQITNEMTLLMDTKTCEDDSNCKVGKLRVIYQTAVDQVSVMNETALALQSVKALSNNSSEALDTVYNEMTMKLNQLEVHYNLEQQTLDVTVDHIRQIDESLQFIREGTKEINEGLTMNAMDAETIALMTQQILDDSQSIYLQSKKIGTIDDELFCVVKKMMDITSRGIHKMSIENFIDHIEKALDGHNVWMRQLEKMVKTMTVLPIQTDASKCAFGHFYHAVVVKDKEIVDEWESINELHDNLHHVAKRVIFHISTKDSKKVLEVYEEGLNYAKLIKEVFVSIKGKVSTMANKNLSSKSSMIYKEDIQ